MEADKQALIDRLLTRIQGVIQARESKYIMLHAPSDCLEDVIALLPGAERQQILTPKHFPALPYRIFG